MRKAARFKIALGALLYALALSGAIYRVVIAYNENGSNMGAKWAMIDFLGNQYYPVRALLEGRNPYLGTAPYSPVNLLLHLPFGLMEPITAAIAYFVFTALLTLLLAWVTLRLTRVLPTADRILFLSAAILISRPGHWTFLLGQTAILLTLATYLALLDESRFQLGASLGVFVDLIKVTFGVPLAVLLWAYGRRRAVIIGVVLSLLVNAPLILLLSGRVGGMRPFVHSLVWNFHAVQETADHLSVHRMDATSFVSRLVGNPLSLATQMTLTAGLLLVSATVVHLLSRREGDTPRDVVIGIVCVATCLTAYHLGYDAVLLTAPLVTVVTRGVPGSRHWIWRPVFLILFLVPAFNWLATDGAIAALNPSHTLWLIMTSLNSVSLLALLSGYVWLGLRYHLNGDPASDTDLANYSPAAT